MFFKKKNKNRKSLLSFMMPDELEQLKIQQSIDFIQDHYKWICKTNDIDAFINGTNFMKDDIQKLLNYEKRYPAYFRNKPSKAWNKILDERSEVEKAFIDRYILSIERKLIDYKTDRGKRNNFNKMVDLFKYYVGEFQPESVDYFNDAISKRFSQYVS